MASVTPSFTSQYRCWRRWSDGGHPARAERRTDEREGLLFERTLAPSGQTAASHASLFSSTWPATHGVWNSLRLEEGAARAFQSLIFYFLAVGWKDLTNGDDGMPLSVPPVLKAGGFELTVANSLWGQIGFEQSFIVFHVVALQRRRE